MSRTYCACEDSARIPQGSLSRCPCCRRCQEGACLGGANGSVGVHHSILHDYVYIWLVHDVSLSRIVVDIRAQYYSTRPLRCGPHASLRWFRRKCHGLRLGTGAREQGWGMCWHSLLRFIVATSLASDGLQLSERRCSWSHDTTRTRRGGTASSCAESGKSLRSSRRQPGRARDLL